MNWLKVLEITKDCITYIVPLFALILSSISLNRSSKGQKLQNRVAELELKLKQYEVAEIEKKKAEASSTCIEARVICISTGKYRLKIWNSGQASAYNVSASFDCKDGPIIISSKMPFDILDAKKSFEENLIVYFGTATKFIITTSWEDSNGMKHSKEQMDSL